MLVIELRIYRKRFLGTTIERIPRPTTNQNCSWSGRKTARTLPEGETLPMQKSTDNQYSLTEKGRSWSKTNVMKGDSSLVSTKLMYAVLSNWLFNPQFSDLPGWKSSTRPSIYISNCGAVVAWWWWWWLWDGEHVTGRQAVWHLWLLPAMMVARFGMGSHNAWCAFPSAKPEDVILLSPLLYDTNSVYESWPSPDPLSPATFSTAGGRRMLHH